MAAVERRSLMKGALVGAFSFTLGGADVLLTPREARAQNAAFRTLTVDDVRRLEAVCEVLVPGARDEGIANFIDQQCSIPSHEALLALRIANVRPPFVNFYRTALAEIDRQARATYHDAFAQLAPNDQRALIDLMRQAKLTDWHGPPQPQVYGIMRDDGVDVVYGTVDGFERLDVPYMPHILPAKRW